jgi:hypothetical protein
VRRQRSSPGGPRADACASNWPGIGLEATFERFEADVDDGTRRSREHLYRKPTLLLPNLLDVKLISPGNDVLVITVFERLGVAGGRLADVVKCGGSSAELEANTRLPKAMHGLALGLAKSERAVSNALGWVVVTLPLGATGPAFKSVGASVGNRHVVGPGKDADKPQVGMYVARNSGDQLHALLAVNGALLNADAPTTGRKNNSRHENLLPRGSSIKTMNER